MNLTIVDVKYEERQRLFTTIRNDQALVVGALAIERLWQPFVNGISKCSYSEQEREDVVRLEGKCLDLIWARIQRASVQDRDWEDFCELFDQIEEISAEVDLNIQAKSFYCAIVDFAGWCLKPCKEGQVIRPRADTAVCTLELIVNNIMSSSMAIPSKPAGENQIMCQDILLNHPEVIAEIQRIDADVELARNYPQNVNLIMDQKSDYHSLDVNLICP